MKELAWQEFGRDNRVVTKTKKFKTEEALQKFVVKLQDKGNLYQILGTR